MPVSSMTNVQWAALVLQDGGWPVTQNNITSMLQWMASENSPATWTGTAGANNPLNNGLGSGGGSGLGSYSDLTKAAVEVAANLHAGNNGYPAIVAAFQQSASPSVTAKAIQSSSWASSHYGGGSAWHAGTVAVYSAADAAKNGATKGVSVGTGLVMDPTGLLGQITNGLTGAASDAASAVAQATGLSAADATLNTAGKLLGDLTSVSWWTRIGMGVLGVGLIVVGAVVFFEGTPEGQQVTSDVGKAAATAAVA